MRIDASDLGVQYGSTAALTGVDLTIEHGETVAVVGASGSGKSTLLKCLSGMMTPTAGSVVVGDHQVSLLSERKRSRFRALNFGFVFQDYNILQYLSAIENVNVSSFHRPSKPTPEQALSLVGLTDRASHLPSEMSGGEQQRVAIARAITGSPAVIFADEPTGALDTANASSVIDLLLAGRSTVICVTHSPVVAERFDRVLSLDGGRLVGDSSDR